MKQRIPTLTVSEIQKLDLWAIEKIGIASLALMENAGQGVAREVYKKIKSRPKASVAIVCGAGNNGGDGFVAARYLSNWGVGLKVFLIGKEAQLKTDALTNYRVAGNLGIRVYAIGGMNAAFLKAMQSADVIVDAIFGVGLNRPVGEPYYEIIQAINSQKAHVVAVDIPSGLDGTTGEIYGICVKADVTVTFSYPKRGFFKKQGPVYTGRQVVVDIGIPHRSMR